MVSAKVFKYLLNKWTCIFQFIHVSKAYLISSILIYVVNCMKSASFSDLSDKMLTSLLKVKSTKKSKNSFIIFKILSIF